MRAKKSLGQNFLRDSAVIDEIVATLELSENDTVVEVGPGRGALTEKLVATGANVIALELDREFVPWLQKQFQVLENFRVIEADVLNADFQKLLSETLHSALRTPKSTKLVGNLPYYISTAILQKLAAERHLFSDIVVMLQREVAERVTANPGNSSRGYLTILIEAAFQTQSLFDVPPTAFVPPPKVWSSVVKLTPKPINHGDDAQFRSLVSAAFAQKRKTILNNLRPYLTNAADVLKNADIDPRRRAETLTLEEWFGLAACYTPLLQRER